jgi:hypothetical protein
VSGFAESQTLGKEVLCRVLFFAECFSVPSAALGKKGLCRVPNFFHSAKPIALGKGAVSNSVIVNSDFVVKLKYLGWH